ncbi:hypothetical protein FACS189447_00700 [Spirochaetia bacterium]|nr:hypothetical protein FACS189447_00700 [Spirochaetia bacterium]
MCLAAVFSIIATGRCSRPSSPDTAPAEDTEAGADSAPAWEALAVLKTGEHPLWFELGETGLLLISSPEDAGLGEYKPWPLSHHIAGMLSWEGSLVLAANRSGFIILSPRPEGGVTLYRSFDPAYWDAYSIASFYIYEDRPAVLLYRDDFFTDPPPPLSAPTLALDRNSNVPVPVETPFLQSPLNGADWEPNALMRGSDGFWYARWTQPGIEKPQSRYLRAPSLSQHGDSISVDTYRNAARPESAAAAPLFVEAFFKKLPPDFADPPGSLVVELVSPSYEGTRLYSLAGASGSGFEDTEQVILLHGFYRESPVPFLFAVLPDGRGIAGGEDSFIQFKLPALPEAYVYTGAGLAGDVLVAAWEEQEDLAVGAAGFMAVNASAFLGEEALNH